MWVAILLIVLGLIYWVSPIDIVPDFIPGWGRLDDLAMTWFLWRLWKRYQASRTGAAGGPTGSSGGAGSERHDGTRRERPSGGGYRSATADARRRSPHSVLGIPPGASPEEIHRAYRRLANQYHPDKVSHLGEEFRALAEKRFKEIQEAYQCLMEGRR